MMKRILPSLILFIIIIVSFFYFTTNITNQFPNATLMNYNLKSSKEPLTIADMETLFESISNNGVAFCCEYKEVKIKEEAVTIALVNENFLNVMNISLKEGISENNITNKAYSVVISDKLALKLFFNKKAENKKLNILGKNFKITDVYNISSSIFDDISKDGKERIYIPYTCVDNYEDINIDSIAYLNNSLSAPLIEQMNLSQYNSVNFTEKCKVIHTFEHLMCFCLFTGFCIISIKIWYLLCRKYFREIKDNLKENYILKSIASIPTKYLLLILAGIGIPLILLCIFFCSDFSVYIVSKYVPNDNIFDVTHYISSIIENANISNRFALTGNNYLFTLYSKTCYILISIFTLFIISHFIIICKVLNKLKTI